MFDRYTKIVLTVIAVALSALAGENAVGSARAQTYVTPTHVIVDAVEAGAFNQTLVPVQIIQ